MEGMHLLRRGTTPDVTPIETVKHDEDEAFSRIRCPLCDWRPTPATAWCCYSEGTPEPPFPSCGTMWNTFSTRGRCPGCGHQWHWTSCPQCAGWSPHDDWYEVDS